MPQYTGLSDNYKNARARAFGLTKEGDRLPYDPAEENLGLSSGASTDIPRIAQMTPPVPPPAPVDDYEPTPQEQHEMFQKENRDRLSERMMMGREQAESNRVTREDINANQEAANRRALLGALSESTAQIGNIRGEYKPSTLGQSFEQMNKADEAALKGRQHLTDQGLKEEGLYKEIGGIDEKDPNSYISQQTQTSLEHLLGRPPGTLKGASAEQLKESFGFLGQKVLQQEQAKISAAERSKDRAADRAFKAQESEKDRAARKELASERGFERASKAETDLRTEFSGLPEVKEFKTIRNQYNNIKSVGTKENPTAADDMSLIFSYMKLMDPNSTVREGEYASARNAAGVPDRIMNAYNKALDGQILARDQRKNFVDTSAGLYNARQKDIEGVSQKYKGLAKQRGVNPENVILMDVGAQEPISHAEKDSPKGNRTVNRFAPGTIPMAD